MKEKTHQLFEFHDNNEFRPEFISYGRKVRDYLFNQGFIQGKDRDRSLSYLLLNHAKDKDKLYQKLAIDHDIEPPYGIGSFGHYLTAQVALEHQRLLQQGNPTIKFRDVPLVSQSENRYTFDFDRNGLAFHHINCPALAANHKARLTGAFLDFASDHYEFRIDRINTSASFYNIGMSLAHIGLMPEGISASRIASATNEIVDLLLDPDFLFKPAREIYDTLEAAFSYAITDDGKIDYGYLCSFIDGYLTILGQVSLIRGLDSATVTQKISLISKAACQLFNIDPSETDGLTKLALAKSFFVSPQAGSNANLVLDEFLVPENGFKKVSHGYPDHYFGILNIGRNSQFYPRSITFARWLTDCGLNIEPEQLINSTDSGNLKFCIATLLSNNDALISLVDNKERLSQQGYQRCESIVMENNKNDDTLKILQLHYIATQISNYPSKRLEQENIPFPLYKQSSREEMIQHLASRNLLDKSSAISLLQLTPEDFIRNGITMTNKAKRNMLGRDLGL